LSTIIDKGVGTAAFIIQEIHVIGSPSLANQKTISIIVIVNCASNCLLRSQTVRTILVGNGSITFGCAYKFSSVPSKGVRISVVITERITATVIGDTYAIKRGELVDPARIVIFIGIT